jgi:hypothetical protein
MGPRSPAILTRAAGLRIVRLTSLLRRFLAVRLRLAFLAGRSILRSAADHSAGQMGMGFRHGRSAVGRFSSWRFNYPTPSGTFTGDRAMRNVSGQVVEIPVKPSKPVKAGDVLFQIDWARMKCSYLSSYERSSREAHQPINCVQIHCNERAHLPHGRSATHCLGGLDADAFHGSRFCRGRARAHPCHRIDGC